MYNKLLEYRITRTLLKFKETEEDRSKMHTLWAWNNVKIIDMTVLLLFRHHSCTLNSWNVFLFTMQRKATMKWSVRKIGHLLILPCKFITIRCCCCELELNFLTIEIKMRFSLFRNEYFFGLSLCCFWTMINDFNFLLVLKRGYFHFKIEVSRCNF